MELAEQSGADVRLGEAVVSWQASESSGVVTVVTNKGRYTAKHLILAAGAWNSQLVPELQVPYSFGFQAAFCACAVYLRRSEGMMSSFTPAHYLYRARAEILDVKFSVQNEVSPLPLLSITRQS